MAPFGALICSLALLVTGVLSAENPWFYALMIDAGSKGTRLIIYKWQPEMSVPRKHLQIPTTVAMKAVNPGLAGSALDPPTVKGPLKDLIDFATESLAPLSSVFHLIPLYLKATAGMRDLIPSARDAVMQETIKFLSGYAPFDFSPSRAMVISGEEEGAHAWLSVNALKGFLGTDAGECTYGVIDLGGASMQIAFVPETDHYVLQNCYPISLTDRSTYRLYAKSYLHYGIVEANRRLAARILMENILKVDSVSIIENPCYYQGLSFSPDFATSRYKIPISVTMVGSGDFTKCVDELKNLFNKQDIQCWVRDCTFDGVYQPRLDNRPFLGVGNIGKLLKAVEVTPNASLREVRAVSSKVCSMSYNQIGNVYSNLSRRMRQNLCFSLAYIYTLLTYGLGFTISDVDDPATHSSQIEFNNYVGDTKVDWALGAVIWEANQQPPQTIEAFIKATRGIDTANIMVPDSVNPDASLNEDPFARLPEVGAKSPEKLVSVVQSF